MQVKGFEREGIIKVSNARVYGLDESIIASGYPMQVETYDMDKYLCCDGSYDGLVTEKDIKRAKHLGNAIPGSGHDCMTKGIILQFDLQVPEYIWRQSDRYHFIDYVSSQSKMHRILKMDIDKACNKYVAKEVIENLNMMIDSFNDFEEFKKEALEIDKENKIKLRSGEEIDITRENLFNIIIANCPSGIMLTARMTTNYLQLKSMVNQRENHKMQEWRYLCEWFKGLPLANELIFNK